MKTITALQSIEIAQLSKDLFSQIISVNATYLTISVSIILGSGMLLSVLMYFLSYKPIKENLNKQAKDIDKIKKETEVKVENLKKSQSEVSNSIQNLKTENKNILENIKSFSDQEVETIKKLFEEKQLAFDERIKSKIELYISDISLKISAIEKTAIEKINTLEEKNRNLDIQTTWDMHYMWEAKNVPVNALVSIVSTLEKSIEASKTSLFYEHYFALCLTKLPNVINAIIAGSPRIFDSLPETLNRLEACISLIKEHEVAKETVKNRIEFLRKELI